ncbi:DUF167 domain-containing protein [Varunaivibrio sulfuroxidans]|uniref:UPF0235 protein EDD55_10192 n=1 Tax=Varunaivibrio sulfuroxidans TaxID=1773489 RepID=A0A4R3JFU3_9PROT|nr:DUF167 family protein [Varunaivibrio sulfuroxidans]TCS64764.1 hypothetical protein EDD55_10192 [Varunaivibrio sulfuroxidans]WES29931.1 DUF167 family protein [Varunaivibrio sulfuroxidans]
MAERASFYEPHPDGLKVHLRLTPKAAANRIGPLAENAQGGVVLKAQVTSVPEGGKANAHLLKMLAKAWRVPKTSLAVVGGATDRNKVIVCAGDGPDLARRLENWILTL